jgi:hypothetical protein
LKQFDSVKEEMGTDTYQISKDSVESLAEILSLDFIDQNLMHDLGEFLYQISRRKKQNFELISEFCENKCSTVLDKLNVKLE